MTALLEKILGLNTKIRTAVLLFALAVLINRCPILITSWCPEEFQNIIFQAAHDMIGLSIAAALWFAKQSNVTGNDSPFSPMEKNRGSVDIRLLLAIGIVALLIVTVPAARASRAPVAPHATALSASITGPIELAAHEQLATIRSAKLIEPSPTLRSPSSKIPAPRSSITAQFIACVWALVGALCLCACAMAGAIARHPGRRGRILPWMATALAAATLSGCTFTVGYTPGVAGAKGTYNVGTSIDPSDITAIGQAVRPTPKAVKVKSEPKVIADRVQ
jgi:hypothetical protein